MKRCVITEKKNALEENKLLNDEMNAIKIPCIQVFFQLLSYGNWFLFNTFIFYHKKFLNECFLCLNVCF